MTGTPVRHFLRLRQVKAMTGLSKTTLYDRIKKGTFPAPVSLGGRSVGWIESEVAAWQDARIDEARPNQPPSQQEDDEPHTRAPELRPHNRPIPAKAPASEAGTARNRTHASLYSA